MYGSCYGPDCGGAGVLAVVENDTSSDEGRFIYRCRIHDDGFNAEQITSKKVSSFPPESPIIALSSILPYPSVLWQNAESERKNDVMGQK